MWRSASPLDVAVASMMPSRLIETSSRTADKQVVALVLIQAESACSVDRRNNLLKQKNDNLKNSSKISDLRIICLYIYIYI